MDIRDDSFLEEMDEDDFLLPEQMGKPLEQAAEDIFAQPQVTASQTADNTQVFQAQPLPETQTPAPETPSSYAEAPSPENFYETPAQDPQGTSQAPGYEGYEVYEGYQEAYEGEKAQILTLEKWQNKKKRKLRINAYLKVWGLLLGLLLIGFIILNSNLFAMKGYTIIGNQRVSDQMILQDLGLREGTNLFRYALSHINRSPAVDSRLSSVDVYFKWPDHVLIEVEESQTVGYVYFQGTYLCIDRKGQVANSTYQIDEDLPIILGLTVTSFSVGQSLNTNDAERYDAVVSIGSNLRKYGIETMVEEINVRNLNDIVLRTKDMEIRVGSMTGMEQKIAITAAVLKKDGIPRGILHVERVNSQIYIEPDPYRTYEEEPQEEEEGDGEEGEEGEGEDGTSPDDSQG